MYAAWDCLTPVPSLEAAWRPGSWDFVKESGVVAVGKMLHGTPQTFFFVQITSCYHVAGLLMLILILNRVAMFWYF